MGLRLGIEIGDWEFEFVDWGLIIGIGDLGFRIGDCDWALGLAFGDYNLALRLGKSMGLGISMGLEIEDWD